MLGCNGPLAGLGYTNAGYYYDASGAPVYTAPPPATSPGLTASQQNLIAQSERPVYTANSAQLAAQNQLIAQSEQPVPAGGGSSGGGASGGGAAPAARSAGVPLISFGTTPPAAGALPSAAGLTPTQQAIAAGYTPTAWAAMTPVQQAAALKAAGYGSTSVGTAGSLSSLFSNPAALLLIGVVLIVAMSGNKK